jgi:hypothetical protein
MRRASSMLKRRGSDRTGERRSLDEHRAAASTKSCQDCNAASPHRLAFRDFEIVKCLRLKRANECRIIGELRLRYDNNIIVDELCPIQRLARQRSTGRCDPGPAAGRSRRPAVCLRESELRPAPSSSPYLTAISPHVWLIVRTLLPRTDTSPHGAFSSQFPHTRVDCWPRG